MCGVLLQMLFMRYEELGGVPGGIVPHSTGRGEVTSY